MSRSESLPAGPQTDGASTAIEPAARAVGMVVVLSGPSGVGKDTVLAEVLRGDPRARQCITVTTRRPRPGEVDGRDYQFRSEEEFDQLLERDYFLEWAKVHIHRYGTPRDAVARLNAAGFDVILKIDVQGGLNVADRVPGVVTIFLAPPSMKVLEDRLSARATEGQADLQKRRRDASAEMACLPRYQYAVVNSVVIDAASDVLAILRAERLRTHRRDRPDLKGQSESPTGSASDSGAADRSQ